MPKKYEQLPPNTFSKHDYVVVAAEGIESAAANSDTKVTL
jgi:hypothetical protein